MLEAKKQMGRPKSEEKKHVIMEAATQLFLEHGFANTTMDAVAAQASVSKQTVYSHFQNKDNLFREMVIAKSDELSALPDLLDQDELPLQELLISLSLGFLELMYCEESIALHRIIISEAVRNPKVAQLFFEVGPNRFKGMFSAYLKRQGEKGVLKIEDPLEVAGHFFCLLKGLHHMAVLMNVAEKPSFEENLKQAESVISIFLKLYGTSQAS
jgi:TetR/AcrR family transcriptional repressor of mexJK operon